MSDKIDGVIEKHYWRAVVFLIVIILIGSAFWDCDAFILHYSLVHLT